MPDTITYQGFDLTPDFSATGRWVESDFRRRDRAQARQRRIVLQVAQPLPVDKKVCGHLNARLGPTHD